MFLALLLTAATSVLPLQPGPAAGFSGTWVLDASRSEGLPEGMTQTMTVKHSGDRIEIETHVVGPQGDQRLADVYVLDGRETDYVPPVIGEGKGKGRRTSNWSPGRTGFESTERADLEGPDGAVTITATRKWTLAPDGRTLTIEMTMAGPQGEIQSTRIFNRK